MKLLAASLIGAWLAVGPAQAAVPQIRADAEPGAVGVGDTFTYLVEVRLDANVPDVSDVRIIADTGPFAQVGAARTTRSTEGSTVVVELAQQLACLDLACAPGQALRRIQLPAARVAAGVAGSGVTTAQASPVTVAVTPRVANTAVHSASPPYRQQTALPAATRPIGLVFVLLAVGSAVLGLVAVVVGIIGLRFRATVQPREEDYARAIRLLRESAARPAPDRRRAADLVSRVADSTGAYSLADDAAHLAWSASPPEPARTVVLAERAEEGAR